MLVRYFVAFILAVVVAAAISWVTRHTWLPWLINLQLDNAHVTAIERFQISREDGGWHADIQQLVIETAQGQQITLNELQVRQLNHIIAQIVTPNDTPAPDAEISIDQMTIEKLGDSGVQPGSTDAAQDPEPKATTARESGADDSQITGVEKIGDAQNQVPTISGLLRQLQALPVRSIEIHSLRLPDTLPGSSTAHFSINRQGAINGDIRYSACDGCLISVHIQPHSDSPPFQFELSREKVVVAKVTGNLQNMTHSAPLAWNISTDTTLIAKPLSELLSDLAQPLPASSAGRWQEWLVLLAQSSGSTTVNLSGQIDDALGGLQSLSNLRSEIQIDDLAVPLPETLLGTPLLISTHTNTPIRITLKSLSPLAAQEISGDLVIEAQGQMQGENTSLLNAEIQLAESSEGLPQVEINGELDQSHWQEILEHPRFKRHLAGYEVTGLSGEQEFSVSFTLPNLNTKLIAEQQYLRNFTAEWKPSDNTEFTLSLPKTKTPAALEKWHTTQISLRGDQPVTLSAQQIPGPLQVSTPQFTVMMETAGKTGGGTQSKLTAGLKEIACTDVFRKTCTFQLDIQGSNLSAPGDKTRVDNLALATSIEMNASQDPASTIVRFSNVNVSIDKSTSGEISAENSELFSQEVRCEIHRIRMHCDSPQLAVSFAPMALAGHSLEGIVFLEDISLTTSEPQNAEKTADDDLIVTGAGNYRADQLTIKTVNALTIQLASHGKVALHDQQLTGVSTVVNGPLQFSSNWQHNLKNQTGQLELTLPTTEFSSSNSLALGIDGLPANLVGGKLEGSAKLHWPNIQRDAAKISLTDAVIQYNDSYAVGIDSTIALGREGDSWATTAPARVSASTIDAGVALKNLHFDLTFDTSGDVVLDDFSAELLEGALTSETVKWNFEGEKRLSTFQFTGISLRALTTELESTNFSASGLLDATIPITIDAQGVTVEDGSVQSRPPGGRMRYYGAFSPQMLSSNPQLKLVAGALEDYTYRDIHGTMQYPLSGDLQLNLKLTGNSQAIDTKRDLIINLNLENNVPSMLRSLQASRDLTDVLEQQTQ
uniref:intermembrane phospholipid transport protein YdbH family protein n=1 Tax=Microbulbifer agarilyticus TaxID=260552 RepID=UPI000492D40F|nr:YdbH domain-containing protein [Microbulbifer agarilyticus]